MRALTKACILTKCNTVNIYTDLAYTYGVCYLFGAVWKQQGFKKIGENHIQHLAQIAEFMFAMMQTEKNGNC